ncbi:MAG: non-canonical purine NTP pyrophosphatase [Spirochaetaceae bacterium]|nr:MAG: non-canonical purine NTP pyrophosphatase [Spirochaetaceae bacterium]
MDSTDRPTLIAATNNPHKLIEFRRLFPDFRLLSPAQVGSNFSYEETGTTYLDNALGKALYLFRIVEIPVLADDSGLEVAGLEGEPGIYSSRYGSLDGNTELSDSQRNAYLLERTASLSDRDCFFVCCMVAVFEEKRFFAVQETFHGILASVPSGSGGFGYDPVVYLPERGKTVAELSDEEKDAISHRGKAARRLGAMILPLFR